MEPFTITEPASGESPLVVEVPHAGLWLDAEALARSIAPARSIARDADLFVDELFRDAPAEGATLLVAHASRHLIDLNRSEGDVGADAVAGATRASSPRGLIWRLTTDGDVMLREPLPAAELTRRLDLVYRPYHHALRKLLDRKVARFGFAVLLCAHSMPSVARAGGAEPARVDVVPGTRGRTSAAGLVIDRVDAHARALGLSVKHDDPYRGGFSTAHYGTPHTGVHAIQVEIARRLYLDDATLRIRPQGFAAVRHFGRTLAARLAFDDPDSILRALRPPTGPRR